MKLRLPVDLGVVLVAGLTMALAGCTPGAMTLAGLSAPAGAASPPRVVSAHSVPSVEPGPIVPIGAHSAPVRCVDIPMLRALRTVGLTSAPHCVALNRGVVLTRSRVPVGEHSAPVGAPVGAASAPHCVSVDSPNAGLRRC